jgi:2-methylcitrate dehydratase PrpD
VELENGQTISRFVEASLGNLRRPMTDRQLEQKFRDQAVLALPAEQVEALIALCWRIDQLDDVGELIRAAVPATAGALPAAVAETSQVLGS